MNAVLKKIYDEIPDKRMLGVMFGVVVGEDLSKEEMLAIIYKLAKSQFDNK